MAQLADLNVNETHPLALEFASLRTTVARFQDEAHTTSTKLQRQSLDAARAHDRLSLLERENDVLRKEIAVLRAHPHPDASPDAHPAVPQVKQLSLSLRQLSDKLSLTEEALLARTTDLAHALSKAKRAMLAADSAHEIAMRIRRRHEADMAREREVRLKLRTATEQINMSDLVVKEYADLVRSLEAKLAGRSQLNLEGNSIPKAEDASQGPTPKPSHTPRSSSAGSRVEEGKLGLQRLVSEFADESERLQREVSQLQTELATSKARLEAQKKTAEQQRLELAKTQTELQKLDIEDNTAAKMVSRYMRFSQTSTDSLHEALASLKARHAATVDTLSTRISSLTRRLQDAEATCERLRNTLDELDGDYMKESYGRRREVALRIKLISREESLMEGLRRWILRAQETLDKSAQESLTKMVNEAKSILNSADGAEFRPASLSLARVIAAQIAADSLAEKLQAETAKRLELQRILAIGQYDPENKPSVNPNESEHRETGTQYEPSSSSVAIQVSTIQNDEMLRLSPLIIESPSIDTGIPAESLDRLPEQLHESSGLADQDGHQDSVKSGLFTSTSEICGVEGCETESLVTTAAVTEALYSNPVEHHLTNASQELQVDWHTSTIEEHLVDDVNHSETQIAYPDNATRTQTQDALAQSPVPEIVVVRADMPGALLFSSDNQSQAKESLLDIPSTALALVNNSISTIPQNNISQHIKLPSIDLQPNHPILPDLAKVIHRYDDLQRNFHDCHFALDALRQSLATSLNHRVPPDALKLALERLTDYIEDARVELEIRIADESLLARGYETLLSIPGALASPDPKGQASSEAPLRSEVELQIEAFVSGTEPSVRKAQESLAHKLSDVQHDIAVLKRAIHDPEDEGPSGPVQSEPAGWSSPLFGPVPATAPVTSSGSSGWASWIRGSPARPSSPAPTFGNVMTSPRLRHSPSLNLSGAGRTGKPYLFSDGDARNKDPLASLGLRVSMPSYVPFQPPAHPTTTSRTVPTMYMLGIGARSASGSLTSLLPPRATVGSTTAESDGGHGTADDVE